VESNQKKLEIKANFAEKSLHSTSNIMEKYDANDAGDANVT